MKLHKDKLLNCFNASPPTPSPKERGLTASVKLFFERAIFKLFILCIVFIFVLTSCKRENCDGADRIYTLTGIKLNSLDSSISPLNGKVNFKFYVDDKISKRDGDRNCRQLDLVIKNENYWLVDSFKLKCSDDLILNKDTLKANTNLLATIIIQGKINLSYNKTISSSESDLYISNISSNDLINKRIKFYISGKTNRNEILVDSCTININP